MTTAARMFAPLPVKMVNRDVTHCLEVTPLLEQDVNPVMCFMKVHGVLLENPLLPLLFNFSIDAVASKSIRSYQFDTRFQPWVTT